MVIISKTILAEFGVKNSDSTEALNRWYDQVKLADWNNLNDIKKRSIMLIMLEMIDMYLI